MLNQKQIMVEWQKGGLNENGYTFQDIKDMFEFIAHNTESDDEANKLMILAIRAAAKSGGKTALAVENNLRKWINAGAITAEKVGDYESQSQQMQKVGRYSQPIQRETGPSKPTQEQIASQNKKMAAELGYESVEAMAKGTMAKLAEMRATRAERMRAPRVGGLTATGRRVVANF